MMGEEVPANNELNKVPEALELSPWLYDHLEERARPMTSQGLPQLQHESRRLAGMVARHFEVPKTISRTGGFTFLSRALHNILLKVNKTETPELYRMIDLPWFRPHGEPLRGRLQEGPSITYSETSANSIQKPMGVTNMEKHVVSRKTTSDVNNEKRSTENRAAPPQNKSEKQATDRKSPEVFFTNLISPPISRKLTPNIGYGVGKPIVAKTSDSQTVTKLTFTSNRLDMPVSSTETARVDSTKIQRIQTQNQQRITSIRAKDDTSGISPSRVEPQSKNVGISRKVSKETYSNISGSEKSARSKETGTNAGEKNVSGKQSETNVAKTADVEKSVSRIVDQFEDNRINKGNVEDRINKAERLSSFGSSEDAGKSIQPLSLPLTPSEQRFGPKDTSESEFTQQMPFNQKTTNQSSSENVRHTSSPAQSMKAPDNEYPDVSANEVAVKEAIAKAERNATADAKVVRSSVDSISHSDRALSNEPEEHAQPVIAKVHDTIEANQVYPAQELIHKKPLSLGQKIMRALPLVRNISRKESPATSKPSSSEKKAEFKKASRAITKIDMVYAPVETGIRKSSEIEDTNASPALREDSEAQSTNIIENKIATAESPATRSPEAIKREIARVSINRSEANQAYPAKELVHSQPYSIGQRIMRSLPLVRNWSKTGPAATSVSNVVRNNDTSNDQLYPDIIQIRHMQEIINNTYSQTPSPPAIQTYADKGVNRIIEPLNRSEVLPGFAPSSRAMDLFIAPINPPTTLGVQKENYETDRSPHVQRAPSPSMSSSILQMDQTSPGTNQTTSTQTMTSQSVENNANENKKLDYKALAREIYPLIKRMIIIERERRPSP